MIKSHHQKIFTNTDKRSNITLIGMSGVGKTSFGRDLANKINYDFIDTDILLKNEYKESLSKALKRVGISELKKSEEKVVLSLSHVQKTVISPGGSVIYSKPAMDLLQKVSKVFYLYLKPEILAARVGNADRAIFGIEKKGFVSLYKERMPLYEKYADYIIDINKKSSYKILDEIIKFANI